MRSLLILLTLCSSVCIGQEQIAKALEQSVMDNLKGMVEEDADKVMATLHSQSATYNPTAGAIAQLFPAYDLSYEIVSFQFIGYDGELAYARVKQLTKKIAGPAFRDNELDMLQVFKQENGTWKIWAQANMSVKYLN